MNRERVGSAMSGTTGARGVFQEREYSLHAMAEMALAIVLKWVLFAHGLYRTGVTIVLYCFPKRCGNADLPLNSLWCGQGLSCSLR